jgi:hypothetical protein
VSLSYSHTRPAPPTSSYTGLRSFSWQGPCKSPSGNVRDSAALDRAAAYNPQVTFVHPAAARFPPVLYICVLHVHSGSCPPESCMLYRSDDPIQDRSTKNRDVFGLGSSFGEPHVWHRCEQAPKTPNAIRLVDIRKARMATSSRRELDGFLTSATHSKRCAGQGIEVDSTPFGAFALRYFARQAYRRT